jgi:hypothetical protein
MVFKCDAKKRCVKASEMRESCATKNGCLLSFRQHADSNLGCKELSLFYWGWETHRGIAYSQIMHPTLKNKRLLTRRLFQIKS